LEAGLKGEPILLTRCVTIACCSCNPAQKEYNGYTPLHRAFRWWLDPGKPNAIGHLLSVGADPTCKDAHGRTPVDLVADSSCAAAAVLMAGAAAAGSETAHLSRQTEATQRRLREGLRAAEYSEDAIAKLFVL
jgi:hypothetical protein